MYFNSLVLAISECINRLPTPSISNVLVLGFVTKELLKVQHVYHSLLKYVSCRIHFEEGDESYAYVIHEIEDIFESKQCSSLIARTQNLETQTTLSPVVDSDTGYFNFRNVRAPTRYAPYTGQHWFWVGWELFMFERNPRSFLLTSSSAGSQSGPDMINLSQIGRSSEGIKRFIARSKKKFYEKQQTNTLSYRPAMKALRQKGSQPWTLASEKLSRSMDTVIIDAAKKDTILQDCNDFLDPNTPALYAKCGRPYRRGLLFYGPPGTGKSSFSYAAASIFGLRIYSLSLADPTITDEDLAYLFQTVPKYSLLVLEDIDSARLSYRNQDNRIGAGNNLMFETMENASPGNLSHSGLITAMDGVAAAEHRVLIMTTNHRERLDPALIRHGRIDVEIEFGYCKRPELKDLFMLMCSLQHKKHPKSSKTYARATALRRAVAHPTDRPETPIEQLRVLAERFAEQLPEGQLSHAKIQEYLLKRMLDPFRAVREAKTLINGEDSR